jgi:hypothetical protein
MHNEDKKPYRDYPNGPIRSESKDQKIIGYSQKDTPQEEQDKMKKKPFFLFYSFSGILI